MEQELLSLHDARLLMLRLRKRASELRRLRDGRFHDWCDDRPDLVALWKSWIELADALKEAPNERIRQRLIREIGNTQAELCRILPGGLPPDSSFLSAEENKELHDALSQAEKLRRRLPKAS